MGGARRMSNRIWKWIVVLGAATNSFFNTGTAKCFGVFISDLKQEFNTGVSVLGLGIGMCYGLAAALSLFTRPLLGKTTCRVFTMIGGLLSAIGVGISSLSCSVLMFTAGVATAGLGFSFMIICNIVILKDYFEESYSVAVSFALAGGAIGMMVLPLLAERLSNIYGWRGAFLLIAGLNINGVVAGALFRPVKSWKCSENSKDHRAIKISWTKHDLDKYKQDQLIQHKVPNKDSIRINSEEKSGSEHMSSRDQSGETTKVNKTYLGFIIDVFDLRLMYDYPELNLVLVGNLLAGATMTGWIAFLVPVGIEKGYQLNDAVLLATIGGTGNIVGRFGVGLVLGPRFTAKGTFIICNILCGFAFCIKYVSMTFGGLSVLAAVNGLTLGAMLVLICLMVEEITDKSRFAAGVALAYLFLGLGEILGGLLAGWFRDTGHTYDVAFMALGAMNFLGAFLTLASIVMSQDWYSWSLMYHVCSQRDKSENSTP